MFKWLNKQGVSSSDGFTLQSLDRYYYMYEEGPRRVKILVDPLRDTNGGYYEKIILASFQTWTEPAGVKITADHKQKLMRNIDDALNFMKIAHVFAE
jgi:hypothetical protein